MLFTERIISERSPKFLRVVLTRMPSRSRSVPVDRWTLVPIELGVESVWRRVCKVVEDHRSASSSGFVASPFLS